MKNQRRLYKSIAICVSVIAAVTMTLPTITSAVGLVGNARSSSAISGAAAPNAPKGSTRSAGEGSDSTSSDDHIDLSNATWVENTRRNLEWTLVGENNSTLVLRQKNKNSTVDANALIYSDDNGIFNKTGSFDNVHESRIKKIVIDGKFKVHNAEHMFRSFDHTELIQGLKNIEFVKKDNEPVKVDGMFTGMGNYPNILSHRNSFKKLDGIENWDMKNVQDAHSMFDRCGKLESLDLSGWTNVNFTDIQGMFQYCDSLKTVKLFSAQSGKLRTINNLFQDTPNLTVVNGFENWNTSNVTDMSWMFANTKIPNTHLKNLNGFENWNTSKVTDMDAMFYNLTALESIKSIENWNTSNVRNMSYMFSKTSSLSSIGSIAKWNTSKVKDMIGMFSSSGVFYLDLGDWTIPSAIVSHGNQRSLPYQSMLWAYRLRDITLPEEHLTKADLPNHIWRQVSGRSDGNPVLTSQLIKPYANASGSEQQNKKYQRMMSDVIKVTFKNKANNVTISCVADAWQGNNVHTLGKAAFYNCKHNLQNNSSQENSKSVSAKDLEDLATKAEYLGLVNLAQIILKSKHSSMAALNNLIREGDNTRYSSVMSFADIEKALGIKDNSLVDNNSIKWNATYDPILDKVAGFKRKNGSTVYYVNTGSSDENASIEVKQKNTDNVTKINSEKLIAIYDAAFTVDAKYNKGKRPQPKPPVPTPPTPEPQPTPHPQPGPQPGPSPEPSPQPGPIPSPEPTPEPLPSPSPTPEPGPAPTPSPSPEPSPDDSDILPDITQKPDLNINKNENSKPNTELNPFNTHNNAMHNMHNVYKNLPQLMYENNAKGNALQYGGTKDKARLDAKEYVGSNSGTCKCVCPTLPKDTKSHKSNKSVRKSSNKAMPCKNGNNYYWLGIGGLIISWLIMLLIGFIVGYKMRKKRDDEQSDENHSAIKDQSL